MEVDMDVSLSSVIDPTLRDEPEGSPSLDPVTLDTIRPNKKSRNYAPGSAADFRRKEANRLAAERSRTRANEKRVALDNAAKTLAAENVRLKAEIAKLESQNTKSDAQGQGASQDEQDQHSRTILAALMSDQAMNEALVAAGADETAWMQGVESLFKEADSSGRLGELAAVASGRNDDQDHTQPTTESQQNPLETSDAQVDDEAPLEFRYDAAKASASTSAAMAVAINAEMEKILREDLAKTKAHIARLERNISRLQEDPSAELESTSETSSLPASILSDDQQQLEEHATKIDEAIRDLQASLPDQRAAVLEAKDAKVEEESRVAALVEELFALGVEGGPEERSKVTQLLKGAGAFVGYLLTSFGGESGRENPFNTTFSSPAIARRRRGRPPKSQILTDYAHNLLYGVPSIPRISTDSTDTFGKKRVLRGKSRLGQTTNGRTLHESENGQTSSAELGSTQALPDTLSGGVDGEVQPDADDQQEVTTAEQYILSHLVGHGQNHRDSSSFVDYLPDHPIDPSLAIDQAGPSATPGTTGSPDIDGAPSVLSRLRKGPQGSCDICGRTETSVWRKLKLKNQDFKVCNPCGLYHAKFGVIRPPELWGDGTGVKKRRTGPRSSAATLDGETGADLTPLKKRKRSNGKKEEEEVDDDKDQNDEVVQAMRGLEEAAVEIPVDEEAQHLEEAAGSFIPEL
ncbi:hypothetical protein BCR39DRAFT_520308 [Naematelia encephala]|uniref:GATA-type domain-containing protein n=1 Tax=Naematelia encephala TaxID=71784 RepID=A0A1Y2BFH5_9TREE|nr:hypothetical protein BCR39DRAFT_520308 [Naematelia encephala]